MNLGARGPKSKRARSTIVIAGVIALLLFLGGFLSDLLKDELKAAIAPYRSYLWLVAVSALVIAVGTAMWRRAIDVAKEANPSLSFFWKDTQPSLPGELIVVLPTGKYGSWPSLMNLGPGDERINRMTLEAHIFEEYKGRSDQTVSVAPSEVHWEAGGEDELGLKWEPSHFGKWVCNTIFTLEEQQSIDLPDLTFSWDDSSFDALDEIDRLVGSASIHVELALTIHTNGQNFVANLSGPLRIFRDGRADFESGVERLVTALPFSGDDMARSERQRVYEDIVQDDLATKRHIEEQLTAVQEQKAIETIARDLQKIDDEFQSQPNNRIFHHKRARLLMEVGAWNAAADSLQAGEAAGENSPPFLLDLAKSQLALSNVSQAKDTVERAISGGETSPDAYIIKGESLNALGDYRGALDAYGKAIVLDEKNPAAHAGRAQALSGLDMYEDSLSSYKQAIALNGVDPQLRIGAALCLAFLHRDDEAIAELQSARNFGLQNSEAVWAFSALLGKEGRASLRQIMQPNRPERTA